MQHEHLLRFPPFPSPPHGTSIVPFSAFVPAGYTRATDASGQSIEVDAWMGLPTIKVLNEHESAQRRKAGRKRRVAGAATDAQGRLIPWWQEWQEGEALRTTSVPLDSHMSFEDRLCLAADDFRVGRTWPDLAQGVRLLWDQFRLYIGLISSIPIYIKVKNKGKGQADGPNDGAGASDEGEDAPKATQTKVVIVQDYLEQTANPGKQLDPQLDESTLEGQRLRAFLDDMEKAVKVFLSSYMRDTGLIWTEKNLFIAPTLLHYFLRFMLRNGVFSDSKRHQDDLERALSVAALAQKELPLTAKHGRILPGQFDLGCIECWDTKGCLSVHISTTLTPPNVDNTPRNDASSAFELELEDQDIEVVPSDVVLDSDTTRQAMENNLGADHAVPIWGDPWTAAIGVEDHTTTSWTDVSVPWLMPLLGPTVLPLTLTTGIIEFSTRRIREVIPPGLCPEIPYGARRASVVEEALEEQFFRVVLAPWVGCASEATADISGPVIAPGSRGTVVAEAVPDGTVGAVETGDDGAWNPYRDDVTMLVAGAVAKDALVVGMGLCGTWVEMVPEGGTRGRYWYMESLVASFPSYYTEGERIGQPWGAGEEEERGDTV